MPLKEFLTPVLRIVPMSVAAVVTPKDTLVDCHVAL